MSINGEALWMWPVSKLISGRVPAAFIALRKKDVGEGVGEDVVMVERLVLRRVDGVVHAAPCSSAAMSGRRGGDVGYPCLTRHPPRQWSG